MIRRGYCLLLSSYLLYFCCTLSGFFFFLPCMIYEIHVLLRPLSCVLSFTLIYAAPARNVIIILATLNQRKPAQATRSEIGYEPRVLVHTYNTWRGE